MQFAKAKDASKVVITKGPKLNEYTLSTAKIISEVVGGTLGPGGCPVLIERQETHMPSMVTKDGVTVFRSLGFDDPVRQEVMSAMRDAAVRTVSEAGDGTTTATILAEAILRYTHEYCTKNPRLSPQRVVQKLRQLFETTISPVVIGSAKKANFLTPDGRKLLWSVAKVSANGDEPLATAVLECFDIVGDDGNVTIVELTGPTGYRVEKLEGFPINQGYEVSCGRFSPMFINDLAGQRCYLENCLFVLYNGTIHDINTLILLMSKVGANWEQNKGPHNVVILAQGFSEIVLGELGHNFKNSGSINVSPLQLPKTAFENSQLKILEDISALTGAKIFDPITAPLDNGEIVDLGCPVRYFESMRYRSNIVGYGDRDIEIVSRVEQLKQQRESASIMERLWIDERIGKLTGGIAKLLVVGSSNGELRERRDRAEDAVMAVRGAIKHGCVPGGGWMFLRLISVLDDSKDEVARRVLIPSLLEPVYRLYLNAGYSETDSKEHVLAITNDAKEMIPTTFDLLECKSIDAFRGGLLDSVPAVLEAIRNSISIASLLGTLGGIVVFNRDYNTDRDEARDSRDFERNSGMNPADERT